MYRKLQNNASPRDVAEVVNGVLDGKVNATGEIVMTGSEQLLTDERIGYESVILFSARANSTFGLPFVINKSKGKATIGLDGLVGSITFDYVVLG